eukprot:jgi/Chlat1/8984/Chrsp94S00697
MAHAATDSAGQKQDEEKEQEQEQAPLPGAQALRRVLQGGLSVLLRERQPGSNYSDSDYVKDLEATFLLLHYAFECEDALQRAALMHDKDSCEERLQNLETTIGNLRTLMTTLRGKIEEWVAACERAPRLHRLCHALELTPTETRAIQFLLVHNIGCEFPPAASSSAFQSRGVIRNMAKFSSMSPAEVLWFLRGSRPHMKQSVLELDSELSLDYAGQNVNIPAEVMGAVLGNALNADEFLKIEGTCLADILREDGFDPSTAASAEDAKDETEEDNDADVDGTLTAQEEAELEALASEEAVDANDEGDSDDVINSLLSNAVPTQQARAGSADEAVPSSSDATVLTPYSDNLDYLRDAFKASCVVISKLKQHNLKAESEERRSLLGEGRTKSPESQLRELKSIESQALKRVQHRLAINSDSKWMPRIEHLARRMGLSEFEKWVVITLIGGILSTDIRQISKAGSFYAPSVSFDVGTLIALHANDLKEQVQCRRVFYRNGALIRHNIVQVSERKFGSGGSDLTDCLAEIDRRMVDYGAGLDTEFGELVEGGSLYAPTTSVDAVVLPDPEAKALILGAVRSFPAVKAARAAAGLDGEKGAGGMGGKGLLLMFYGESGTGKTMMANALAAHVGKRILLITPSQLGEHAGIADTLKLAFREAKVSDSILFIDEAEAVLQRRESGNYVVTSLLVELEKHEEVMIMATSRPQDVDDAVHRRVALAVNFPAPDASSREKIWRAHAPERLKLAPDVDWKKLAVTYELTGGLIKNAILQALSFAVQRDESDACVRMEDLERACALQDALTAVTEIVGYVKAKKGMAAWGFFQGQEGVRKGSDDGDGEQGGVTALLHGDPGTGKSLVAEAIAFETGRLLLAISCGDLLAMYRSPSKGIAAFFRDARNSGAVLQVDDADPLITPSLPSASLMEREAVLAAHHGVTRYPHAVILCTCANVTNLSSGVSPALARRLDYVIHIPTPTPSLRKRLWELAVPAKCPLANDVDFARLADMYELNGSHIVRAAGRAAAKALAKGEYVAGGVDTLMLGMKELMEAAESEVRRVREFRLSAGMREAHSMYS